MDSYDDIDGIFAYALTPYILEGKGKALKTPLDIFLLYPSLTSPGCWPMVILGA